MRLGKNIKIFLNFLLGPLIFIWLSYSLYRQIIKQPNLENAWNTILESFNSTLVLSLVAVLLLMFFNWAIEAEKWKIAVHHVQNVSFLTAFKAVFSGVSFSVTMPNRIGEYFGRVLYMDEGKRLRVISLTILGSASQLLATLFFGLLALYLLKQTMLEKQVLNWAGWINIILYGGTITLTILTVLFFRLKWISTWFEKIPKMQRYSYLFNELEKIDATLLLRLLSLSVLRYLVFGLQYYLLYRFFGVEISWWQAFWTMAVLFLVLAMVPTIALVELGLRGEILLKLAGMFSPNLLGIGFTTVTIWFINLFVPAAIGSLLILSVKIFRGKNETV